MRSRIHQGVLPIRRLPNEWLARFSGADRRLLSCTAWTGSKFIRSFRASLREARNTRNTRIRFLGAGGRLPKTRRGRIFSVIHHHHRQNTQRNPAFLSAFLGFPWISLGLLFLGLLGFALWGVWGSGRVVVSCDFVIAAAIKRGHVTRRRLSNCCRVVVGSPYGPCSKRPTSTSHLAPLRPCGGALCHVVSLHARLPLASEHGECSCRRRRAAHNHTRRRRRRVVVSTSVDDRSSRSGAHAGLCSARTAIATMRSQREVARTGAANMV